MLKFTVRTFYLEILLIGIYPRVIIRWAQKHLNAKVFSPSSQTTSLVHAECAGYITPPLNQTD